MPDKAGGGVTQNTKQLKHKRHIDPIRAAKARRGTLKSQTDNEIRLAAGKPKPAWKDRSTKDGLTGTLAERRRFIRQNAQKRRAA